MCNLFVNTLISNRLTDEVFYNRNDVHYHGRRLNHKHKDMYRLRFNLGRGDNYQKWQVKNMVSGNVTYFDPASFTIMANGVRLVNSKNTAAKIHQGANKTVCAYVLCNSLAAVNKGTFSEIGRGEQLSYNPKVRPHWAGADGSDIDDQSYDRVITTDRRIFIAL